MPACRRLAAAGKRRVARAIPTAVRWMGGAASQAASWGQCQLRTETTLFFGDTPAAGRALASVHLVGRELTGGSPSLAVLIRHLVTGREAYHFRDYRKLALPLSPVVVGSQTPLMTLLWPLVGPLGINRSLSR